MKMTFRQLEILAAAANALTFSAAAEALGVSQPALSEAIRRIEKTTGTVLFERTTRSLKLSDAGRHAAAIARELVRDFDRAMERLRDSGDTERGQITVAALPSVVCTAMAPALKEFARAYPGIAVALHDVQHERAMAMVGEGA